MFMCMKAPIKFLNPSRKNNVQHFFEIFRPSYWYFPVVKVLLTTYYDVTICPIQSNMIRNNINV